MIVIGANAAGLSAASKARRLRPDLEITVFEQSGFASYGACGLPYFVGGKVKEAEDLISLPVEQAERYARFEHRETVRGQGWKAAAGVVFTLLVAAAGILIPLL